jgi:S-DNA-T family DNA segregation ATPase FtsK/SpoIIIE
MVEFNQKIIQAKRRGELFYCPESPRNPRQPMGHLPYIVIVINELADLMVGHRKQVQTLIACLAQKARATGIHLVVTTKNPHDNVVTELIRANIPARIAFQVHSRVDSTTILNTHGAETLLGMGDMLYRSGNTETIVRVHGAFISMEEIQAVVNHIRDQCPVPDYVPHVLDTPVSSALETIGKGEDDPIYEQVMIFLLDKQITSAPELERRFKITHQRAIELLAQMEKTGIVSTMGHAGKRDVLTQNFSLINNKNATP